MSADVSGYLEDNAEVLKAWSIAADAAEAANTEDKEEWDRIFDAKMLELGWDRTGDHCLCGDPDEWHEPACGWTRVGVRL